ncbi:hypothetical protein GQ44DRAFT_748589 [Phaeosphaeriaceae sp. PMI808]|nr:hypothetical protein GQ44DRAFT_748589 [Phaeosphaeriaceae sp. PMI808]
MPGKRKRVGDMASGPHISDTATASQKPQSAIAAARLKAEATKGVVTPELILDPVIETPTPKLQSRAPELQESESDEESLPVKENFKLCNWRNESQNILSDTKRDFSIKLNKHTTVALIGAFQFKVLRGAVNINGANIGRLPGNGEEDPVYTSYAPATHPISKIRGLDSVNHVQFTNCVEARPLANSSPLFADIWSVPGDEDYGRSFSIITESDADILARPLSPEKCPEDWLRAVESCAISPSTIFLTGASGAGKSTFARRLLNRFLTGQGKSARPTPAVCYLDLDPAKPEYTPHGQISLIMVRSLNLGPNFTHPIAPSSRLGPLKNELIRSHAIPVVFVNYKDYYCACVENLFLAYRALQSPDTNIPLIINPSSSLYNFDFAILTGLLARFKPHHLIHVGDPSAIDAEQTTKLHSLQSKVSQYSGTFHGITAQLPLSAPMRTDAEIRAMQMQSYFHLNKINTDVSNTTMWTPSPLSTLTYWDFCFEETDKRMQDFVGFAMYSEPVEPASLIQALNGLVVQIIESTSSSIPTPYTALSRTNRYKVPYFEKSDHTGMVMPLDPKTSKLICTALIRGFNLEEKTVQLVVPKMYESVLYSLSPERTVFVGGCCETPEWAYVEDAYAANGTTASGPLLPNMTKSAPWVEDAKQMSGMGYLNTVRRVRKFQT